MKAIGNFLYFTLFVIFMAFSTNSSAIEIRIAGIPLDDIEKNIPDTFLDKSVKNDGTIYTLNAGGQKITIIEGQKNIREALGKISRNDQDYTLAIGHSGTTSTIALKRLSKELERDAIKPKEHVNQSSTSVCASAYVDLSANFSRAMWMSTVSATFHHSLMVGPPPPYHKHMSVWARVDDMNTTPPTRYQSYDEFGPFGVGGVNIYANVSSGAPTSPLAHVASAWGYIQVGTCGDYLFMVEPSWNPVPAW